MIQMNYRRSAPAPSGRMSTDYYGSNHDNHEVGDAERVASIMLGGTLVAASLVSFARGGKVRGLLFAAAGGALARRGITGRCVGYRALGIESGDAHSMSNPLSRFVHIHRAITINASADDLYQRWRDFTHLPQILSHIKDVEVIDETRSKWSADGPLGAQAHWTAIIERDEPGRLIAWRSEPGSMVQTQGQVEFISARAGRGAIIKVDLIYHPPGGAIGAAAAKLFGSDPDSEVRDDLRRFKQAVETGEVTTNAGPSGRDAFGRDDRDSRPPRAARGRGLRAGVGGEISGKAGRPPEALSPDSPPADAVEEASKDSFPASDPPPY